MTSTPAPAKTISAGDAGFAHAMLKQIAFIRALETKALELTQTNPPRVMGSMHFCAGQEAVPLGALAALRRSKRRFCDGEAVSARRLAVDGSGRPGLGPLVCLWRHLQRQNVNSD